MKIFTHKTDAMRYLITYVNRGYVHYTQGVCHYTKFNKLAEKFNHLYDTFLPSQKKWKAKEEGKCVTKLIAWTNEEDIHFILLSTQGMGAVIDIENMKNLTKRKERLVITGYELVKEPRKDLSPAWTYRMTDETFQDWKKRIKTAIRSRDYPKIRQVFYSLSTIPLFRGTRQDGYKLNSLARGEWVRSMPKSTKNIFETFYLGFYGRYQKAETITLQQNNNRTFMNMLENEFKTPPRDLKQQAR